MPAERQKIFSVKKAEGGEFNYKITGFADIVKINGKTEVRKLRKNDGDSRKRLIRKFWIKKYARPIRPDANFYSGRAIAQPGG